MCNTRGRYAPYRCGFPLSEPKLRFAQPDDLNFVRSQWIQSFVRVLGTRHFEAAALFPAKDALRAGEWALANRLLSRSTVPILEADGRIVAFMVLDAEAPAVHYAWVAEDFRRKGLCRRLLMGGLRDQENWVYTRVTPTGKAVGSKLHGKYDPYLLFDLIGENRAQV